MRTELPIEEDRAPVEPPAPGPEDCCHSGCAYCVQDQYEEALERYRAALKAWQLRQAATAGKP